MVWQLRQQFYQEVLGLSYSYGGKQTSFRGASVCVSIETCQDGICTFLENSAKECTTGVCEEVVMGSHICFLGLVAQVLLMIGAVVLNMGHRVHQGVTF